MDEVTSTFWLWRTALEMENLSRMKLECFSLRAPIRQVLQIRLMMDRASEIRSMEEEKFRRKIRHMRGLYTCSSNEQLHMFSPPPHSFVEGFLSCVPNYHGGGGDNACYNSSRGENVY
ncbi:uncharacterized protein [Halyomorpha halys]|uniref:uncharacterized protein isoform X2 n=1 Tax=Halyomorpha halys TaxID=286706 RepID=UPI0006D4D339|nr:uncharacterized protein LOC106685664 isoform X2 [Halyomorpha halys]